MAGRWAVFARLNRQRLEGIKKSPGRHFFRVPTKILCF